MACEAAGERRLILRTDSGILAARHLKTAADLLDCRARTEDWRKAGRDSANQRCPVVESTSFQSKPREPRMKSLHAQ